jgi:hypothetical protein
MALFILSKDFNLTYILDPPIWDNLTGFHILKPSSAPLIIANINSKCDKRMILVHFDLINHSGLQKFFWDPVDLSHVKHCLALFGIRDWVTAVDTVLFAI